MPRAARALSILMAAGLAGCRLAAPRAATGEQQGRCHGVEEPRAPGGRGVPEGLDPPYGARIAEVRIAGTHAALEAMIREAIATREGSILDAASVAKDVRAVHAIGVFEDVRVDAEQGPRGLLVVFRVVERPLVERVVVEGDASAAGASFLPVAGDVYDAGTVARARRDLEGRLRDLGYQDASVRARAPRASPAAVDLCFVVERGPLYRVRRFAFTGNRVLSAAALREAVSTRHGKVNVEGGIYRADLFAADQERIRALAYDRGLLDMEIAAPEVQARRSSPSEGSVDVVIPIDEGPAYHVHALGFRGALAAPRTAYDALVDVRPGDLYVRSKILALVERVKALHQRLGRKDLDVVPETRIEQGRVLLSLHVVERSP
jgi:outer membrane protein insertion porin family